MVLALGAGGVAGALRYAHPVFGLRLAAVACLRSGYSVLILAGDGSIAGPRVDGSFVAIRAFGYTHSVLSLGFAAIAGLCSGDSVRIFLGNGRVTGMGIVSSCRAAIFANGFAAQILDAILRHQPRCQNQTRHHHQ